MSKCPRHPDGDGPSWCQDCHGIPSGFDARAGEALREKSIKQVDEHADEEVKASLLRIGRSLAYARDKFTTDAVRYVYEKNEGNPPIREPRVLGPIMRKLEGEGLIVPLDEWKLSEWEKNHRRPIRIWASKVGPGEQGRLI